MNTISLTEQAFRQGADEAQRRNWDLPPREVVVWEPGQINRPQDFGHEQEKARPESQPGCSGPSTTVGRMVPGFDGGCTVTDTDEDHLSDLSEDISPDPLEKQTSVWEFATVLVSTPQVMTAPVFSIGQGQQAELLHWGKEVAASGENELSRGASDERVQQELAAGDKEMPQSPSVAHKEIGLVVLEERSTEATDRMSERHTGAAAERDPDKLMAKEIANLDQSGETEKERSGHVKSDESSGTSWDGGKRTPLSTAQSDTRSDEDDDVFVSARESEASVTSKSSLGTKSANLLLLTVTDKPEFECTWTSPSEVTDIFSSQFEHIMECQRLKGTSYNSLDSLDVISSTDESECGFSFETPLTPMIQQRIKESSQFMELAIEETASGTRVLQPCMDTNDSLGGGLEESVSSSALDHLSHKPSLYAVVNGAPQLSELFQEGQKEPSTSSPENAVSEREPSIVRLPPARHHRKTQRPNCTIPQTAMSERGLKEMLPDGDLEVDSMEQLELHGSTEVVTNGNKSDLEAARRLAKRLYNLEGFKRSDVARHLGKNNDFSKLVAEEYLRYFDFTGLTLDQSLRFFLKAFALMGETQERERVLIHFSERYYQCNMGTIPSQDGVHCLTCAMMLLNTDLHGHVNIGKKMTCQDFINNLDGLNGGKDFPKDLLKALYNSIKNEKLEWAINEEELRKSLSELANDKTDHAGSKANNRIGSGTNPFLDIPQDPNAKTYKTGFLSRKLHADMDGKKSES
ncbi:PH and SEC7 domain-containing protein 1-like isoform X6 [Scyliorhinus torazame]